MLNALGLRYKSQYRFARGGWARGRYYFLDFAFPDQLLAVECDGHDYHSSARQRSADRRRQREIEEEGWRVLRFTGSQIVTRLADCGQAILQALKP